MDDNKLTGTIGTLWSRMNQRSSRKPTKDQELAIEAAQAKRLNRLEKNKLNAARMQAGMVRAGLAR
jgi:hypothetical protein